MSISSAFSIARSGLSTTEGRANLVAGNIANAQTEGYVRREAAQVTTNGQSGTVELRIARQVPSIFDFRYEDFAFEGYDPAPAIKAAVAV